MNETEREWRVYLLEEFKAHRSEINQELKEIRKENKEILETLTTLKVKVGVASGIIGGLGGLIMSYFKAKIGQ
jgi:phage-related tail protein